MREAVSAEERLIATLRVLATGRTYKDLKYIAAISPSLMSTMIPETCAAVYNCLKKYIKMPASEEQWKKVATTFEETWNFPHCRGALDEKHVAINKPPGSGSLYFNYKKFFSVIMFALVDANYRFMYIKTGINGSVSDSTVFESTKFCLGTVPLPGTDSEAPYVFLGDSAFALNKHFMKPYTLKNISHDCRIFNYRLSRARRDPRLQISHSAYTHCRQFGHFRPNNSCVLCSAQLFINIQPFIPTV
ncbi:hypothetical protein NQ318_022544 [Aromia moschata]|uniref:DDE Tnp4 domain-containing protein n=1 Tax=Aromia moschata TaxID=1265417 RepID=A0AAV8XKY8_9CUCU|nr:hypothetical protein NQ318_022544 [Aromia moschata]